MPLNKFDICTGSVIFHVHANHIMISKERPMKFQVEFDSVTYEHIQCVMKGIKTDPELSAYWNYNKVPYSTWVPLPPFSYVEHLYW